jgi:hypothetical protein
VNAACNKPARKPDAGNPPVRFDEGEGSFIGPSLLYSSLSLEGSCLPVPPGVASNAPPRRIPRSKPISRSKIEDEDDYRQASCMKSVANQIKSDR